MFEGWQYFHFLRPCWLLGILAAPLLYFITQKRLGADYQWRNIIAPHLLEHLKVRPAASAKFRPIHLISLFIILAALALAGPAWQREPSPFSEDKAPLVIALDLSQTMDAVDIAPTRLERAKLKITDLLQLRQGARTALLVYAGSAHTVLPFTDDPALLNMYIESLSTHIMPSKGKAPQKALKLAASLLDKSEIPGTILFFTDGISGKYAAQFTQYMQTSRNQIAVLAFGTREGGPIQTGKNRFLTKNGRRVMAPFDYEGLHTLSQKADIPVIGSTVDDNDVERLQRSIQTHLQAALAEDESLRWRDNGYYLLFPIVLLAALWFRKGWTLQWRA
ncbi:MAG TPA: VWA domain-containing protein [Caldithrix abyssi]|uniref:VWA domain-containing protein n=1 Tax=Caldithrix abyssi TaxID=187145 RepID=A0A7V4UCK0_CALAY|nr:VWA domain-containing protein [Caldithrix abyssi]